MLNKQNMKSENLMDAPHNYTCDTGFTSFNKYSCSVRVPSSKVTRGIRGVTNNTPNTPFLFKGHALAFSKLFGTSLIRMVTLPLQKEVDNLHYQSAQSDTTNQHKPELLSLVSECRPANITTVQDHHNLQPLPGDQSRNMTLSILMLEL